MNKYKFKLLTSTGLGHEYFYCYGDEHFEQWLKRKNMKYEIDKKSINRFNKQKEVLDKIKNNNKRIIDYGFDYDGFNNVEDLKKLIDMLLDYARKNYEILEEIK